MKSMKFHGADGDVWNHTSQTNIFHTLRIKILHAIDVESE